jgi:hypothetical protein
MIADCLKAGLPEPDFRQCGPHFVTTLWRDWLTESVLAGLGINERQYRAVEHVKKTLAVTSAQYRGLTGCTARTATRDLDELVSKGVLEKVGSVGRGAHYVLQRKPDINRTNRTSGFSAQSAINRTSIAGTIGSHTAQSAHASHRGTRPKPVRK